MKFRKALVYILVLLLVFADVGAIAEGLVLKLPSALKTVGEEAFYGDTSLEKVVVPDGVTSIGARAFANSSVSQVDLPDTLTFISDDAFAGCGDIAFTVPEDCYAFDWCVRMGYIATEATFERDEVWLRVGESVDNPASIRGISSDFIYESGDPEFVTVNEDGRIEAVKWTKASCVIVTATSVKYPGKTAQCRVYISNEPTAISFAGDCLVMGGTSGGQYDMLNLPYGDYDLIRYTPADAAPAKLTFETGDPNIAIVDESGIVMARTARGETTVTVRTENGLSATVPLRLVNLQTYPTIRPNSGTYAPGMEDTFHIDYSDGCYGCYYLEYDKNLLDARMDIISNTVTFRVIADVTSTVMTQIRVCSSIQSLVKGTYTVTILPASRKGQIAFESNEVHMTAGATRANAARCLAGTLCTFDYESDHPDYVSVDTDGTLHALKNTDSDVAFVTITARSRQNAEVMTSCRVYVRDAADQIEFKTDCLRMGGTSGGEIDALVIMYADYDLVRIPEDVQTSDLIFESGDPNLAVVDGSGIIWARAPYGETTITVRTNSGLSATVPLKVQHLTNYPVVLPTSGTAAPGMEGAFSVEYPDDCYGCYYLEYDSNLLDVRMDVRSELNRDTISYRVIGNITGPVTTQIKVMCSYKTFQKGVYTLTLLPAPKQGQVSFAKDALRMEEGDTLANAALCASGTLCEFAYESDHPDYVSVDADGTLHAHKNTDEDVEYVIVTARSLQNADVTASCKVTVSDTPEPIRFNTDCLKMGGVSGGRTDVLVPWFYQYILIRRPESEDVGAITFTTADPAVATVGSDGRITARTAFGETTVTMCTESGLTATVPLKVFNLQTNPVIVPASGSIGADMEGSFRVEYNENCYSCSYLEYDENLLDAYLDMTGELRADTVFFRVIDSVTSPVTTQIRVRNSTDGALKGTYALTIYPAPRWGQVVIDSDEYMEIGMGDTSFTVHAVCTDNTMDDIRYSSDHEQYVTVDAVTGVITAVKPMPKGMTATVTAYALHNPSAKDTCTVATFDAPDDVNFARAYLKLGIGESLNLREEDLLVYTPDTARATFQYESSAPGRISVDDQGTITALSRGSAVITAVSYNDIARSIYVYAYESTDLPVLEPASDVKGTAMRGSFRVAFPMGSYKNFRVEYDEALLSDLTVDRTSEKQADTVTYTVKEIDHPEDTQIVLRDLNGEEIAVFALRVVPAPQAGDVTLPADQQNVALGLGNDSFRLTPICAEDTLSDFVYTSDLPDYVSVDADTGVLNAKAVTPEGVYATVTAVSTANPEAKAESRVTVQAAPETLTRTAAYVKAGVYDGVDLFGEGLFVMEPEGSVGNTLFTSSNADVASVDQSGVVTCHKKGSAVITARTYNDLTASITVYVYNYQAVPQLSADRIDIGEDSAGKLDIAFESGCYGRYTVESTSELLVIDQIDTTGRTYVDTVSFSTRSVSEITEAKLRVLGMDGTERAVCTVNIYPAPAAISCTPTDITIGVGEEGYFVQGSSPEGTKCNFIYESDNPDAVAVAQNGAITAKAEGTAKIIVAADNSSARAECTVTVKPKPTGISVSRSIVKLGEGETFSVTGENLLTLEPANCKTTLHFTSTNVYYATVDQDGVITAHHPGRAVIRVTTHNGFSCAFVAQVYRKGEVLADIEPEDIVIGANMDGSVYAAFKADCYSRFTAQPASELITVTGYDRSEEGSGDTVFFHTGMVDQQTQMRLSFVDCDGTVIGYATVTVQPGPDTVSIADANIGIGETNHYADITYGEPDRMCAFEYESDAPGVAIVDNATNQIIGLSAGTAHITAHSTNSEAVTQFTVTVHRTPAIVDYEDLEYVGIAAGDTIDIPAPHVFDANYEEMFVNITYAVDDPSVAQVIGSRVTGVAPGSTQMTASTDNGLSAVFTLTVSQDTVTGVVFDESDVNLYTDGDGYDDSVTLSARVVGEGITHGALTFSLLGESDAITVTENGVVNAVSIGDAQVTAVSFNGVSAEEPCSVHVRALTSTLALDITSAELGEGMSLCLTPVFDPDTGALVVWGTEDPDVALVSMDGVVSAVGTGTTRISAKVLKNGQVYKNLEAYADITVIDGPEGISMRAAELDLARGEEVNISDLYTLRTETAPVWEQVIVKAQDETVVEIGDEKITALAEGSTMLLFTTCNGFTGQMIVNVVADAEETENGFVWDSPDVSMIGGLKQEPEVRLNLEGILRGYTFEIENPADRTVLVMDEEGKLNAVETGTAVLRLLLNAVEGTPQSVAASVNVTVYTYQDVQMDIPEQLFVVAGEMADLSYTVIYPENLICDIPIAYTLSNGYVQFLPMQTVLARSNGYTAGGIVVAGEIKNVSTYLTFFENPECTCEICVPLPKYRALLISEYNNNPAGNCLPFAANNITGMQLALSRSCVDGESYDTKTLTNPSKSEIATAINTHFADATSQDVSLVYIVSHGHNEATTNWPKCYNFSLTNGWGIYTKSDPSTYITSYELLSYLSTINGNVVLLLDSCVSGAFIENVQDSLDMLGNISVMTAQDALQNASYFVGDRPETQVEFFTYALCYGMSVEIPRTYLRGIPADTNPADGNVTIDELFTYADGKTKDTIAEKRRDYPSKVRVGAGGYPGEGWYQDPQTRIASGCEDLVLYQRIE